MRCVLLVLLLSAAAGAAGAAPAPAAAPTVPRIYQAAGYSQPEITANHCRNVSPSETDCTIPAMTAGAYMIEASGLSTASGPGASQAIVIRVENAVCAQGRSVNTGPNSRPWTSGPQTIRLSCVIQVVADAPLRVSAAYDDEKATKDPKGPALALRRLPWNPVLQMGPVGGATDQPAPAR